MAGNMPSVPEDLKSWTDLIAHRISSIVFSWVATLQSGATRLKVPTACDSKPVTSRLNSQFGKCDVMHLNNDVLPSFFRLSEFCNHAVSFTMHIISAQRRHATTLSLSSSNHFFVHFGLYESSSCHDLLQHNTYKKIQQVCDQIRMVSVINLKFPSTISRLRLNKRSKSITVIAIFGNKVYNFTIWNNGTNYIFIKWLASSIAACTFPNYIVEVSIHFDDELQSL